MIPPHVETKRLGRGRLAALPLLGDAVAMGRLILDREAHWVLRIVVLATLAYVVSPLDAIPDTLAPVVAWLDDIGLFVAVRLLLDKPLSRYRYPLFAKPRPALGS